MDHPNIRACLAAACRGCSSQGGGVRGGPTWRGAAVVCLWGDVPWAGWLGCCRALDVGHVSAICTALEDKPAHTVHPSTRSHLQCWPLVWMRLQAVQPVCVVTPLS